MNIASLLSISSNVYTVGVAPVSAGELSGIGWVIGWIFDLFSNFYGAVALGAIVFTLALKTLVLPLDIYSRVKTKKQSLLMERMRPQMEKLQKQYANDKNMYQQKVMELQKANGYNPLSACLPMIVSLVIFMIILSSFSTYSNYSLIHDYSEMAKDYNETVSEFVMADEDDDKESHFLIETNLNGNTVYRVDFEKFATYYEPIYNEEHKDDKDEDGNAVENPFVELGFNDMSEQGKWEVVSTHIELRARERAAYWYRHNDNGTEFGWIGNLWYPDSMLNKAVPNYTKFTQATTRAGVTVSEADYNNVTYNLNLPDPEHPDRTPEMQRYNGYFVLIVLSIGLMFLQQFVMMKSQKAANELSSVDGSAARTNKMMMIIMPIIFGLFSFMYSAAFSLYMITNTVYGLVSTLIINKIVTVKYANKELKTSSRPTSRARKLK